MSTFRQLLRKKRKLSKNSKKCYNRSPKMNRQPQRKAIILEVTTTKPKKPNSAVRKIAKLQIAKLKAGNIRAVIPGQGNTIKEFDNVLFRAGRSRDIPGMHYKLIRGALNFRGETENFVRVRSRSKYGLKFKKKYKRKVISPTVRKMYFALGYRLIDDSRTYVGDYTMYDSLGQMRTFVDQGLEDDFKEILKQKKQSLDTYDPSSSPSPFFSISFDKKPEDPIRQK